MARKHYKEYALYKGEEYIASGTIKDIAGEMGVKESSIRFLLSPAYKKRSASWNETKKGHRVLVCLGRIDEEM